MRLERNTVFILGAGFTKAFLPDAPLLIDDYGATDLLEEFKAFPTARAILENEVGVKNHGKLDLERVMTRASAGMPYDSQTGASEELSLLFARLKDAFETRLGCARRGKLHSNELRAFARLCIDRRITVVTFNYDDLLDHALYGFEEDPRALGYGWNPNGGYGFFCRPAWAIVHQAPRMQMDEYPMHVLKLHGSVNWRVRLGYSSPFSVDSIVHYEEWTMDHNAPAAMRVGAEEILRHIEPSAFLVPPILAKDALVREPILRLIWTRAFAALANADLVVFVGYSFPVTDIAARFLFTEAIRPETRLRVVSYARNKTQEEELRANYRKAFPNLRHDQFSFEGALEWSRMLASQHARGLTSPSMEAAVS